jgi:hypothetical protein
MFKDNLFLPFIRQFIGSFKKKRGTQATVQATVQAMYCNAAAQPFQQMQRCAFARLLES